jgi:two-component system, NtrC family, response regulator AtoC
MSDAATSFVATSRAMNAALDAARRAAAARSPVLLLGESGSGKGLLARQIHFSGPRRGGAFVPVHCPSLPAELMESELFGHERGAFTDARSAKPGRLELAAGGSVYLDQVQDLPLAMQAKLLRVVDEMRFERVGGTRTLDVDARVIASASPDLRRCVAAGAFREDLFHRLNGVPIVVPPLRERREDILPLAELFLANERSRGVTVARGFEREAEAALLGYAWPGNVRELRAAVERAALYAEGATVPLGALPEAVRESPGVLWRGRPQRPRLREVEQAYIRHVLEEVEGNQTRAAAILGISRKALWEKRRRYGIP